MDEKVKLGIDTSAADRGASQVVALFEKMNTGMKVLHVGAIQTTKDGQLINAALVTQKTIMKDNIEVIEKYAQSFGRANEAITRFNARQQLIYAGGGKKGYASISENFSVKYSKIIPDDSDAKANAAIAKEDARMDAYILKVQRRAEREAQIIQNGLDKQSLARQNAITKQEALEQEYTNRLIARDIQVTNRRNAEQNKINKQHLAANQMNFNKDWDSAKAEDSLRSQPTYFNKLFNQASAIATGIIISQTFMRITSELTNSVSEATKLEVKLSEIRTIAGDSQRSLQAWSETVRGLSDRFGTSTADTTEAIYQTLSNQVKMGGSNIEQFIADANKLAAVTVTSSVNAVNLLSSALNAYGKTAGDANEVSASMFKLIELGRVRVDEIANSIGGLYAISARLRVPLDEVNAAISAMTKQGVTAANAQTYLKNILNSLLKPSENMKKVFESWGVASGEAALDTFKLLGVLEKMDAIVQKGGLEEVAADLKNLRSITGVALLSGSGLEMLKQDSEGFLKSSGEYASKVKIAYESAGKELQIQFQKIKNFFVFDFGQKVVDTFGYISKNWISLSTIMSAGAKTLGIALAALAGGQMLSSIANLIKFRNELATLPGILASVIRGVKALTISLFTNPWFALGAAIAGVITYLLFFRKTNEDVVKEAVAEAKEAADKLNLIEDEKNAKIQKSLQESVDKQYNIIYRALAGVRERYSNLRVQVEDEFHRINDSLKEGVESFQQNFNDGLKEIDNQVSSLKAHIKSMKNELVNFNEKRDINEFEDQIENFGKAQKAVAEMEKAQELASRAHVAQYNASQYIAQNRVEESKEAYTQAKTYLDEAMRFADKAQKNIQGQNKDDAKEALRLTKENAKALKDQPKLEKKFKQKADLKDFEFNIEDLDRDKKAAAELAKARELVTLAVQEQAEAVKLLGENEAEAAKEAFNEARAYFDEAIALTDKAKRNSLEGNKDNIKNTKEEAKLRKELKALQEGPLFGKNFDAQKFEETRQKLKEAKEVAKHTFDYKKQEAEAAALQLDITKQIAAMYVKQNPTGANPVLANMELEKKAIQQQVDLRKERNILDERQIELEKEKLALDEANSKKLHDTKKRLFKSLTEALGTEHKPKDTDDDIERKMYKIQHAQYLFEQSMRDIPNIVNFAEGLDITKKLDDKLRILKAVVESKREENELDKARKEAESKLDFEQKKIKSVTDARRDSLKVMDDQIKLQEGLIKANTYTGTDKVDLKLLRNRVLGLGSIAEDMGPEQKLAIAKQYLDTVREYKDAVTALNQDLINKGFGDDFRGHAGIDTYQNTLGLKTSVSQLSIAIRDFEKAQKQINESEGNIRVYQKKADELKKTYENVFGKMTDDAQKSNADILKSFEDMIEGVKKKIQELKGFEARIQIIVPDADANKKKEVGAGNFGNNFAFNNTRPELNSGTMNTGNTFGDIVVNIGADTAKNLNTRELAIEIKRQWDRGTAPLPNALKNIRSRT